MVVAVVMVLRNSTLRPDAENMANCVDQIGPVHGVKMKIIDAGGVQRPALFGGDVGGIVATRAEPGAVVLGERRGRDEGVATIATIGGFTGGVIGAAGPM